MSPPLPVHLQSCLLMVISWTPTTGLILCDVQPYRNCERIPGHDKEVRECGHHHIVEKHITKFNKLWHKSKSGHSNSNISNMYTDNHSNTTNAIMPDTKTSTKGTMTTAATAKTSTTGPPTVRRLKKCVNCRPN